MSWYSEMLAHIRYNSTNIRWDGMYHNHFYQWSLFDLSVGPNGVGIWRGPDEVQLTTLRRILRAGNNSMIDPLFSETGILPIRYRRAQLALWYLMNVLQTEPPIPRKALIETQYLARENKTCYYNYCGVLQDGSRPLTGMTMTLRAVMRLYRLWRPGGSRMGPSFSLIRRFSHWVFGW